MNKVFFSGNTTREVETRVVGDTTVASVGIAVNKTYKTRDGEKKEQVDFFDLEAWGPKGDALAKYVTKGTRLVIEAEARNEVWEDKKSGEKRSKVRFRINDWEFAGSKKVANATEEAEEPAQNSGDEEDDIPF
jgi:single-strand DNA-binding protein